jgi:hypothetical protein
MAKLVNHLFISIENTPGKLAEVTGNLREAGVNITSMITFGEGAQGNMVLGTSDNAAAKEAIAGSVNVVNEMAILIVTLPDKVGAFHEITSKIGEAGISIEWACATCAGGEAAVMLTTSDNARAAEVV